MEIEGGGQPFILPSPQSPFQGQSCHGKSFTQGGKRDSGQRSLNSVGKKSTVPRLPLCTTTAALFSASTGSFNLGASTRGPQEAQAGPRDCDDPNQANWDQGL